jgi:hypothetical protein
VTTSERALHVLIHDIRTPVGVAQGYLRLLREDRLPPGDQRERALAQAQLALDKVSGLCTDAAALVGDEAPAPRVVVSAERLVGRVIEHLERQPVAVRVEEQARGLISVAGDADRLADAVTRVLLARPVDRAGHPGQVSIGVTDSELWFTSGIKGDSLSGQALDPWKGGGFSLPLACQTIANAGGRVWAAGANGPGTGVALPIEVTP